jgi:hypothetical protein
MLSITYWTILKKNLQTKNLAPNSDRIRYDNSGSDLAKRVGSGSTALLKMHFSSRIVGNRIQIPGLDF